VVKNPHDPSLNRRIECEPKPARNRTKLQINALQRHENGSKADQKRTETGSKVE
jgi:hypothetical protein